MIKLQKNINKYMKNKYILEVNKISIKEFKTFKEAKKELILILENDPRIKECNLLYDEKGYAILNNKIDCAKFNFLNLKIRKGVRLHEDDIACGLAERYSLEDDRYYIKRKNHIPL